MENAFIEQRIEDIVENELAVAGRKIERQDRAEVVRAILQASEGNLFDEFQISEWREAGSALRVITHFNLWRVLDVARDVRRNPDA